MDLGLNMTMFIQLSRSFRIFLLMKKFLILEMLQVSQRITGSVLVF